MKQQQLLEFCEKSADMGVWLSSKANVNSFFKQYQQQNEIKMPPKKASSILHPTASSNAKIIHYETTKAKPASKPKKP
jgi:hypothetical protein